MWKCCELNDIVYPKSLSSAFTEDKTFGIQLSSFQQRYYKIRARENHIKMDEDSLLKLFNLKSYVKTQCQIMDSEREANKLSFFKLLKHFCHQKTIDEVTQLSKLPKIQHFFYIIHRKQRILSVVIRKN